MAWVHESGQDETGQWNSARWIGPVEEDEMGRFIFGELWGVLQDRDAVRGPECKEIGG